MLHPSRWIHDTAYLIAIIHTLEEPGGSRTIARSGRPRRTPCGGTHGVTQSLPVIALHPVVLGGGVKSGYTSHTKPALFVSRLTPVPEYMYIYICIYIYIHQGAEAWLPGLAQPLPLPPYTSKTLPTIQIPPKKKTPQYLIPRQKPSAKKLSTIQIPPKKKQPQYLITVPRGAWGIPPVSSLFAICQHVYDMPDSSTIIPAQP